VKLLIVGAGGQLGGSVARQAVAHGELVVATYLARPPTVDSATVERFDKTDTVAARALLARHRPEVVIDTGALHNVDFCESHPEEANRVNRDATAELARVSRDVGARFLFVSTDFVFDGGGHPPYQESDAPHPQSVYARSKLEGERAVLGVSSENLVVRPSVIYSWLDTRYRASSSSGKGVNFGTWLVEEVRHGREVRIVEDQVASPTLAEDLAAAILALVGQPEGGVFHAAGATALDRYSFSVRLVERLGLDGKMVHPVRTAELNQKAARPSNSALDSRRLLAVAGHRMLALDGALDRFADAVHRDPGY
jgi:dTDP-4-dehydrorhamnose reductase